MADVDLETAIKDFLDLGRRLQRLEPLTGERVLEEVMNWYRSTRISGAELDEDGDMLLLQWGRTEPLELDEPTDLRGLADDDLKFAAQSFQFIDITRQVHVCAPDGEDDFDETAVQMAATLCYGHSSGDEAGDNLWINTPDEIGTGTSQFRGDTFVKSLLTQPATRLVVTVGHCG